jgi:C4-dicarboxylate transporter DctM subunit
VLIRYMMRRALQTLGKAIDRASEFGGNLSVLIIVATAFAIVYEIIMRAIFRMPTKWLVEYSTYGVIFSAFLGAAYLEKIGSHIHMDVILSRLSAKARLTLEFFNYILGSIMCGILFIFSSRMVMNSIKYSTTSVSILRTPMYIPESVMTAGVLLLTLQLVKNTVHKGILLAKPERSVDPKDVSSKLFNHPIILLSFVMGLMILGILLFSFGGSLRTIGVILLLLTLFSTGMPIFLSLTILGSIGLFFLMGGRLASQQAVATLAYKALDSFTITAIPLYILGSGLLGSSGIGDKLFDICRAWFSRLPGNLSIASIAACAIFAAISGSSVATAAAIGSIAIPAMVARNYDEGLALGCVAGGGTLGILIPPSLQFLLYGAITETSVGQLFIAGIIPGALLSLFFMFYVFITCRNDVKYASTARMSWSERVISLKKGGLILPAPVIVIGGLYSGIFTPTEAAGVLVIYAIFASFLSGGLNWQHLIPTMRLTITSSVMVLMIIVGAIIFGGVVTLLRIPQDFTEFVIRLPIPSWGVIILINILILFLGMFIECVSITLITVPILFPAIIALGYNPVWFGVLFTINMELALITPPVGLNLYVIKGITNAKFETIVKGVWPFMALLALGLILVGLCEPLATWLPSTMIK